MEKCGDARFGALQRDLAQCRAVLRRPVFSVAATHSLGKVDVVGGLWQVVRRLTSELKDTKMARNMEKATIDDRLVQELQRQLDELKKSRDRQNDMLATVKNARWVYLGYGGAWREGGGLGGGVLMSLLSYDHKTLASLQGHVGFSPIRRGVGEGDTHELLASVF